MLEQPAGLINWLDPEYDDWILPIESSESDEVLIVRVRLELVR